MVHRHERLQTLIEPSLTALGYELVGVEYVPGRKAGLLRVYIDSPDGITLEDCERVSHQISGVLEVEDPIHQAYSLEVSSPGLDRPLFTAAHFERFAGQQVRVKLAVPVEGRRNVTGALQGLIDGKVVILEEGVEIRLPLEAIGKAQLIPELDFRKR